jgi:hypothetical protein
MVVSSELISSARDTAVKIRTRRGGRSAAPLASATSVPDSRSDRGSDTVPIIP